MTEVLELSIGDRSGSQRMIDHLVEWERGLEKNTKYLPKNESKAV